MRKKNEEKIVRRAIPDLFGDGKTEVHSNYVCFQVPSEAYKKIREWLNKNDRLEVATGGKDDHLKLCILNKRKQRLYEVRGYRGN
jgi:hypothetical protein